ncbi:MAG: hypothetical protein JWN51_1520 [Phycisphaerales bacterium]|nr:hypothetical protein [Phycisphaerales bacterium]
MGTNHGNVISGRVDGGRSAVTGFCVILYDCGGVQLAESIQVKADSDSTHPVEPMSRRRMIVATCAVVVIIVGHALSIATQHPHWPFHAYTMYSGLSEDPHYDRLKVVGVTAEGREVPFTNQAAIAPIPLYHLRMALMWAECRKEQRDETLSALCRDALDRYEARRRASQHSGTPLVSLRLYQMHWDSLDPHARDAATPTSVTLRFDSAVSNRETPRGSFAHLSTTTTEEGRR